MCYHFLFFYFCDKFRKVRESNLNVKILPYLKFIFMLYSGQTYITNAHFAIYCLVGSYSSNQGLSLLIFTLSLIVPR